MHLKYALIIKTLFVKKWTLKKFFPHFTVYPNTVRPNEFGLSSEVYLGGSEVTDFSEILAPEFLCMASLSLKFEAKIRKIVDFFLWANFFGSIFWGPKIAPFSAQIFHHLLHFHNFAFSKCFTTCCTLRVFENSLEKSWHIELEYSYLHQS